MSFDLHTLIISLGALQGFLLASFLFSINQKRRKANLILGWLILLYSLSILIPELSRNFYRQFPHLLSATDSMLYLFGPLIYFYTLFLTGKSNNFTWRDGLHLIPFLFGTLILIPFYLQTGEEKLAFYDYVVVNGLPSFYVIGWTLECLHVAIYMFLSLRVIADYRTRIKETFSNLERINLQWLKIVAIGNMIIWILDASILISYLFGIRIDATEIVSHLFGYLTSIFIYFIGYKALKQPEVFSNLTSSLSQNKTGSAKYIRSGLTKTKSDEYEQQLIEFMNDESPYLNPDISLGEISEALSIPNNHLSQVINEKFEQNFFDFINSYRVKEAKEWLSDPQRNNATMLAIAFESGFKSKSTFNAAFKKHVGQTPSEYKKSQLVFRTA